MSQFGHPWKRHVVAAVVMPLGATFVLGAVVLMNELSEPPEKREVTEGTAIEVVKQAKPKPKQRVQKPKPKPRQTPRSPPPPSLAALTSGLGGIAVEIPGLDLEAMNGAGANLLGTDTDVAHTSDTVDESPRARTQTPIRFPPSMRKKGIEGYVLLSLLVDKTGNVQEARVLESDPPGVFDNAAVEGVRGWQFEPGQYKGEPVRTWVQQRIAFRLRS